MREEDAFDRVRLSLSLPKESGKYYANDALLDFLRSLGYKDLVNFYKKHYQKKVSCYECQGTGERDSV